MIPRPAQCDDDRCDYDNNGWAHVPGCRASNGGPAEDMATATAREDGCDSPLTHHQQNRRAAA